MKQVAVIGGGASGLAAAITAAKMGAAVTIYERGPRVGKKLLATGNGRCNISNRFCTIDRYHGGDTGFVLSAMEKFDLQSTEKFFGDMGLMLTELDDGKLYPRPLQASAVLDVLRMEIERLHVRAVCDCEIEEICLKGQGFTLWSKDKSFFADAVILAAGGEASPQLGGTDSGYQLLRKLGHSITQRIPSIVQLKTDVTTIKPLSGMKIDGRARLFAGKKEVQSQFGEILFTDYGVSGPPIMQISGAASRLLCEGKSAVLSLDLMPELEQKKLYFLLKSRAYTHPERSLEEFFVGMLPKRLGQCAMKAVALTPLSRQVSELADGDLQALAAQLKDWRLIVKDTNGFRNAQVTAGGASVTEFQSQTMESKLVSGLYACGEVLDVDGDCGGFNLQWAWSSGRLAGLSAAEK